MKSVRNWQIGRVSSSIRTTSDLTSRCILGKNWCNLAGISYLTRHIHPILHLQITTYSGPYRILNGKNFDSLEACKNLRAVHRSERLILLFKLLLSEHLNLPFNDDVEDAKLDAQKGLIFVYEMSIPLSLYHDIIGFIIVVKQSLNPYQTRDWDWDWIGFWPIKAKFIAEILNLRLVFCLLIG